MKDEQSTEGPLGGILGLHLAIPSDPVAQPPNNLIGTLLLQSVLQKALAAAGQLVGETRAEGELNESLYFFGVRDFRQAGAIIKSELENHCLSAWAHLAWHCPAEHIWRTFFPLPEPCGVSQWDNDAYRAKLRAVSLKVRAAVALMQAGWQS